MTSTSERPRLAAGQTAEGDIASFLARTEPVGALAQDGYLAGHDGRAIAQAAPARAGTGPVLLRLPQRATGHRPLLPGRRGGGGRLAPAASADHPRPLRRLPGPGSVRRTRPQGRGRLRRPRRTAGGEARRTARHRRQTPGAGTDRRRPRRAAPVRATGCRTRSAAPGPDAHQLAGVPGDPGREQRRGTRGGPGARRQEDGSPPGGRVGGRRLSDRATRSAQAKRPRDCPPRPQQVDQLAERRYRPHGHHDRQAQRPFPDGE